MEMQNMHSTPLCPKSIIELFDSGDEFTDCLKNKSEEYINGPHKDLNGKMMLYEAVKKEKVAAVLTLLDAGADPARLDPKIGKSPLHLVCERADPKLLTILVDHIASSNADHINVMDSHRRRTPLHGLLQQGYQVSEQLAKECFSILLDHEPALPLDLMVKDATSWNVLELTKEKGLTWLSEEFQRREMRISESATNIVGERPDPVVGTPPLDSMTPVVINVTDHTAMATQVFPTKY